MVLRHVLAVLCEIFLVTPIMTDGWVDEDPLHGFHARQTPILCIFYLRGHIKTIVYATQVVNEEALHHCIVDV
jgi:hypothetical protein